MLSFDPRVIREDKILSIHWCDAIQARLQIYNRSQNVSDEVKPSARGIIFNLVSFTLMH